MKNCPPKPLLKCSYCKRLGRKINKTFIEMNKSCLTWKEVYIQELDTDIYSVCNIECIEILDGYVKINIADIFNKYKMKCEELLR